jgi:hypothetical protein
MIMKLKEEARAHGGCRASKKNCLFRIALYMWKCCLFWLELYRLRNWLCYTGIFKEGMTESARRIFLRNGDIIGQDYILSQPRIPQSESTGLCSGKAPDSYSGYVWFEYRPEHRVS